MGRVKSEKAGSPPPEGPLKTGAVELNTAKPAAKKPKFAKRWLEVSRSTPSHNSRFPGMFLRERMWVQVHAGTDPRVDWFKSEKVAKVGGAKAEGTLPLLHEPDLPGLLQPRGEYIFECAVSTRASPTPTRRSGTHM